MTETEKAAFSARLIKAMRASPEGRKAGTKHGVDVAALQRVTGVSREMARRYVEGNAIPRPDAMRKLSTWLNVRQPWLRDGEDPMRPHKSELPSNAKMVAETSAIYDPQTRAKVERLIEAVIRDEISREQLDAALTLLLQRPR